MNAMRGLKFHLSLLGHVTVNAMRGLKFHLSLLGHVTVNAMRGLKFHLSLLGHVTVNAMRNGCGQWRIDVHHEVMVFYDFFLTIIK